VSIAIRSKQRITNKPLSMRLAVDSWTHMSTSVDESSSRMRHRAPAARLAIERCAPRDTADAIRALRPRPMPALEPHINDVVVAATRWTTHVGRCDRFGRSKTAACHAARYDRRPVTTASRALARPGSPAGERSSRPRQARCVVHLICALSDHACRHPACNVSLASRHAKEM
jgi:hypothetical protein